MHSSNVCPCICNEFDSLLFLGDSPLTADIRLETESDYGSDEEPQLFLQSNYKPRKALAAAISDWMVEIHSHNDVKKKGDGVMALQATNAPTPGINTCMVPTLITNTTSQPVPVPVIPTVTNVLTNLNELVRPEINGSYLQPVASQNPVNSLVDSGTDTDEDSPSEPMDCMVTPGTTPASTSDSIPLVAHSCLNKQQELCDDCSECKSLLSNCDSMQVDSVIPSTSSVMSSTTAVEPCSSKAQLVTPVSERCLLTEEDIILLVDLFYMPFEHGSTGIRLLTEFNWLKANCFTITEQKEGREQPAATEWRERAQKFRELVATIGKLTERLCNSPNQGLVYDMFPYVWDIWGTASLLGSFIEWLGMH